MKKLQDLIDEMVVTEDMLNIIVKEIFKVAREHHLFCPQYAQLCQDLNKGRHTHRPANLTPSSPSNGDQAKPKKTKIFRRLLLGQCQSFFEEGTQIHNSEKNMSQAERDEKEQKRKGQVMGNVKFIGQLFKHRMIHEKIVHICINDLIKCDNNRMPTKNDIEAVCNLLKTVGKELDHVKAKTWMDKYFKYLPRLANYHDKRTRFLVQDIQEMRLKGWPVEDPVTTKTSTSNDRNGRGPRVTARGPQNRQDQRGRSSRTGGFGRGGQSRGQRMNDRSYGSGQRGQQKPSAQNNTIQVSGRKRTGHQSYKSILGGNGPTRSNSSSQDIRHQQGSKDRRTSPQAQRNHKQTTYQKVGKTSILTNSTQVSNPTNRYAQNKDKAEKLVKKYFETRSLSDFISKMQELNLSGWSKQDVIQLLHACVNAVFSTNTKLMANATKDMCALSKNFLDEKVWGRPLIRVDDLGTVLSRCFQEYDYEILDMPKLGAYMSDLLVEMLVSKLLNDRALFDQKPIPAIVGPKNKPGRNRMNFLACLFPALRRADANNRINLNIFRQNNIRQIWIITDEALQAANKGSVDEFSRQHKRFFT